MSDYDRGAYTPQTDAPLAFDPRRPSERRPMPMALIGSGVVLVILLAGVAMVYRGGVRHAGESPRPVGEPVMAVKTAPPATTASSSPPANMDVYEEGQANTTSAPASAASNQVAAAPAAPAPTFAPTAEEPAPRPAPRPSTVAMLAKPTAPNHIVRPPTPTESAAAPEPETKVAKSASTSTLAKSTAETKTETAASGKPALRPASHAKLDQAELAAAGATRTVADESATSDSDTPTEAKPKKPVKTAAVAKPIAAKPTTAATPVAVASTATSSAKAVVQIGAFSSSTLADKGYADVSAALPDRMGGKAKHVQPLDKDGATLYRTWLSGFASRQDAVDFCEALKAKGKTCLVKG